MTNDEAIKYAREQLEVFGGTHREFLRHSIEVMGELEVYIKALELMSIHLQRFQDCKCFGSDTWAEYFLEKVRKEEWLTKLKHRSNHII